MLTHILLELSRFMSKNDARVQVLMAVPTPTTTVAVAVSILDVDAAVTRVAAAALGARPTSPRTQDVAAFSSSEAGNRAT